MPADPDDRGGAPASGARVVALRRSKEISDAELLARIRAGERTASALLFDRYGAYVRRVVARVVGCDVDLEDMVHDAFVGILRDVGKVERAEALQGWIRSVAVFTARGHLRARARRRWLRFFAPGDVPDVQAHLAPEGASQAARAVWQALDRLPVDERIAFTLRHLEELELAEIAEACRTSLSTVKRRLRRAEERFDAIARTTPALADWRAEEGGDAP